MPGSAVLVVAANHMTNLSLADPAIHNLSKLPHD